MPDWGYETAQKASNKYVGPRLVTSIGMARWDTVSLHIHRSLPCHHMDISFRFVSIYSYKVTKGISHSSEYHTESQLSCDCWGNTLWSLQSAKFLLLNYVKRLFFWSSGINFFYLSRPKQIILRIGSAWKSSLPIKKEGQVQSYGNSLDLAAFLLLSQILSPIFN